MMTRPRPKMMTVIALLLVFCALFLVAHVFLVNERKAQTVPWPQSQMKQQQQQKSSLVMWSSDFHISPIADIKAVMEQRRLKEAKNNQAISVEIIDKSLSGHCHLTNTCHGKTKLPLHIIDKDNGIDLSPCPNLLINQFYDYYTNKEHDLDYQEMKTVDAFICTHAISLCELFMPFNRPMIAIASTRYEIGRYHPRVLPAATTTNNNKRVVDVDYGERWKSWNRNLMRIAQQPGSVIAANNRYDQEYIKYFTSLEHVEYLPPLCLYINDNIKYNPTTTTTTTTTTTSILIAPARGLNEIVVASLLKHVENFQSTSSTTTTAASKRRLLLSRIRDLYPTRFEYSDLTRHHAIVILPYQVSFMSFFEYYRMAIPLFLPSLSFLVQLHQQQQLLSERTWNQVFNMPPQTTTTTTGTMTTQSSVLPRHKHSHSVLTTDPNDDVSTTALLQWLNLSDYFSFPHIVTFDSFDELLLLLSSTDFNAVSLSMRVYHEQLVSETMQKWNNIVSNIHHVRQQQQQQQQGEDGWPSTVNESLEKNFKVRLKDSCIGEEELP